MSTVSSPLPLYEQQLADARLQLDGLWRKRKLYGWLRLACLSLSALLAYLFLPEHAGMAVAGIAFGIACFLLVLSRDTRNDAAIGYQERQVRINETEIALLDHRYTGQESGAAFQPAVHPYAADLDLLGDHSLFQYLNRCSSEQGKALLAQRLLQGLPASQIGLYQQAAKELAPQLAWRQQLQNKGMQAPLTLQTEQQVMQWLAQPETRFTSPGWPWLVRLYPLLPCTAVVLYLAACIPLPALTFCLFILFLLTSSYSKAIGKMHVQVGRIAGEINTLGRQLLHLEQANWQADHLRHLQQQIRQTGSSAASALLAFQKTLNRFDYRLQWTLLPLLNTFLAWDIRQAMHLQQWKRCHRALVPAWFRAIEQAELVHTLATLHFNHPQWAFPVIDPAYFRLQATALGHPLIPPAKRVSNSCSINGTGQVLLITGSNMAGKSTFLRSLGVNTVLAMMGAPVCAAAFTLSPIQLLTSMRITDNLAENTSTFYAELKKLQFIISKVKAKEQVFILLDEILRGTNSLDRHAGSQALVKQLIREQSIAVVATHDVELAGLQKDHPEALANYHFDVQVTNEELYFDYRLKEGVCKSMNALLLMKKIGITMD